MDEMLLLMIGEKDDTTRKWGCGRREEWHLRDSHSARCIAFRAEAVCGALYREVDGYYAGNRGEIPITYDGVVYHFPTALIAI